MAEKLNNFEYHHLQNDFYHENNLNQMLVTFLFYLVLLLNLAFVANVATSLSKSVLFINPAMSNLVTISFFFFKFLNQVFHL